MNAYEIFMELGKELSFSKTQCKKNWHIFRHLPIKENDKVLLMKPNELLMTWLLSYGIASSVEVLTNVPVLLEINDHLKNRNYLNMPSYTLSEHILTHHSDYHYDLIISLDNSPEEELEIYTLIQSCFNRNNYPKVYYSIKRNFYNLKSKKYNSPIAWDLCRFPNSISHAIFMYSLSIQLDELYQQIYTQDNGSKKVSLVPSYTKSNKSFNSFYKDLVIK